MICDNTITNNNQTTKNQISPTWILSIYIRSTKGLQYILQCEPECVSEILPFPRKVDHVSPPSRKGQSLKRNRSDEEFQECNFESGWWFQHNQLPPFSCGENVDIVEWSENGCEKSLPWNGVICFKLVWKDEEDIVVYESGFDEFEIGDRRVDTSVVHVDKDLLHKGTDHVVLFFEEDRLKGVRLFVPEGNLPQKFKQQDNVAKELGRHTNRMAKRKVKFASSEELTKELLIDLSLPPASTPYPIVHESSDSTLSSSGSTDFSFINDNPPKSALRSLSSPSRKVLFTPLNVEYDTMVGIITEINKTGVYIDPESGARIYPEELSDDQLVEITKQALERPYSPNNDHRTLRNPSVVRSLLLDDDKYEYNPHALSKTQRKLDMGRASCTKKTTLSYEGKNLEFEEKSKPCFNLDEESPKPSESNDFSTRVFRLAFYSFLKKFKKEPVKAILTALNLIGYWYSKKRRTFAWPILFGMLIITGSINNILQFRKFKGIFGHGIQTLPHL